MPFETLTPDIIISIAEKALGIPFTGLVSPLPSYINRVYELRAVDNTKIIVKLYRPGRWTQAAIQDELTFIADCQIAELPVVPPMVQTSGLPLGQHDDMFFALFPKRAGRQFEICGDDDWIRMGSLIARMHLVGEQKTASARIILDPLLSTVQDVEFLCTQVIPSQYRETYKTTAMGIVTGSAPLFNAHDRIRIHGDCHRGNILDRLDEGLVLIDFDDMVMGPPVQDLWLLLPDRAPQARKEIELFLDGYEQLRDFNRSTLRCIEPLRAMRMIFFLAWCSRQQSDFQFAKNFPNWGNDAFWAKELNDLKEQSGFVMDAVGSPSIDKEISGNR